MMRTTKRLTQKSGVATFAVLLAAGAAILGFACGGDDEENKASGSPSDAKGFFEAKVHQSVSESCADCHRDGKNGAPVFLGANAGASYSAIEGFPGLIAAPSFSPIVQKGIHSGPALTATQTDLVTQWLTLEVKGRKLDSDPGVPKNLRAAFKQFGACMDYEGWKAAKLHTLAAMQTEEEGECRSCHNYGQASLWLSGGTDNPENREGEIENATTFLKMREFPYVQRLVVGRVTDDGTFDGLEPSRRIIDKGTEAQQLLANSHPRYALSAELTLAVTNYVRDTISRMNANQCATASAPDAGLFAEAGAPE